MDVLMCLAGAVVVLCGICAGVGAVVAVLYAVGWVFAQMFGEKCLEIFIVVILSIIVIPALCAAIYILGCDLAESWGWCAGCGLTP